MALVIADLFLMLNGYELSSSPAENVLMVLGVADGSMSESELVVWVRGNVELHTDEGED
jgi:prophage maintenance system killer protein